MAARKTQARKQAKPSKSRQAAQAEEREDDEEEMEEEPEETTVNRQVVSFDPSTHGLYCHVTHTCVLNEAYASLVSARNSLGDIIQADAKRSETQFMGFQTNASILQQQLQDAYTYGNQQRDEAERQRARVTQTEMELSRMIRQSEDAKLERDRLSAELKRGEVALQRLEMELEHKERQRKAELDAVRQASAPIFAAAAQGVGAIIQQYGGSKIPGLGAAVSAASSAAAHGGAATGPASASAPNGARPTGRSSDGASDEDELQLNFKETAAFKTILDGVYAKLGPRSIACLRALICSAALPGAPPVPSSVNKLLPASIMEDAGGEAVMALLQAAGQAYVAEDAHAGPAATSGGSAASPPN